MSRTLTANITASKDLTYYAPVFVVVVSDGTNVLGRWTTYKPSIAGWDGANAATGGISKISDIRHDLDWRGGLSNMSELTIDLVDDGTIAATLSPMHPYTVEIWLCFDDGTPTKAKSILVYIGALDSWEATWGGVSLRTSDIRERRYPAAVLTKVGIDNETALCGYGLVRSSDTAWDVDIVFNDEWLPENTVDELIPICFNAVRKARGILVSKWPGADDLDEGNVEGGRYLRGPLFVFSDPRLSYGDDDGNFGGLGTLYHYDTARKVYSKLTDIGDANTNDVWQNYLDEYGDQLAAVFRPIDDGNNALHAETAVNFLMRLRPRTEEVDSVDVLNNPLVLRSGLDDHVYDGVVRSWAAASPVPEVWVRQKLDDVPAAGRVRAAWYEVNAAVASGALGGNTKIAVALQRGTIWGGSSEATWLTYKTLLSASAALFNNWENSAGANKDFEDAQVLLTGVNPFVDGSAIGPRQIGEFTDKQIRVGVDAGGSTTTADVRYYGCNIIVAADVPLEDVRLVADVGASFDTYVCPAGLLSTYLSPSHCLAQGTIYGTLLSLFGLSNADDLADDADWEPIADANVPYTYYGGENRLDFQLAEDISGKDLVDRMCRDASLWLIHDQAGKEVPRQFRRVNDTTSGPHAAALTQSTIKSGSYSARLGPVDDLYNRFRLRYWQNPTTGEYEQEIWVDENGGNLPVTHQALIQGWCAASQAEYGIKKEMVYEAPCIQDPVTAWALILSLACKHVRRPRMVSLTTWLNAVDMEECDFPVLDHPHWQSVAKKCSGTTANLVTLSADITVLEACGDISAADVQRGDWVYITSDGAESVGLNGWYRVRDPYPAGNQIYLFCRDLTGPEQAACEDVTWYVVPAMMVAGTVLRPGSAEIDVELVEIVKAPESIGDGWTS